MTVKYSKKRANLEEIVTVEEAEGLQDWLKKTPGATVNIGKCQHVHAAALQVILALKPKLAGQAQDRWLNQALATLR